MQVYWLQENIVESTSWIVGISSIIAVGTLIMYFFDMKWARYYGSNKIDDLGIIFSIKGYQRFTFTLCIVCVCVCVYIYSQFIGVSFSNSDIQLIYLKPRPHATITFQDLKSYEIRNKRFILYSKKSKHYQSVPVDEKSIEQMERIILMLKEYAPWIEEWGAPLVGKMGKIFLVV